MLQSNGMKEFIQINRSSIGQGVGEGVNACPVGVSGVTPVPSQAGCGSWMKHRVEASPEARGAGARPWEAGGVCAGAWPGWMLVQQLLSSGAV